MNKKLIVAAVSAAVMAPVAAHAESSFYARVNNAIDINDLSGDGTTDISGVASRFGFKGSADVGNGMTVHGRYEFSTTSDKEGTGVGDTRIATAGLSGGFGRIDVGNQWSSYFNTFGTLISPTYSLGYYLYSSVGGGPYRSSNTIKYSNTFGPLYAELDVRLNDSGESGDVAEKIRGDGIGLGLSFSVTDNITIAAAFDNEEGADIDAFGFGDLGAEAKVTYNKAKVAIGATRFADRAAVVTYLQTKADDLIDAEVAEGSLKDAVGSVVQDARDAVLHDINSSYDVAVEAASGADEAAKLTAVLADVNKAAADAELAELDAKNKFKNAGSEDDVDRVGIAIKATFGDFWGSLGHQSQEKGDAEVETTFAWVGGSLGEKTSWLVGYAVADDAVDSVTYAPGVRTAGTDGPKLPVLPVEGNDDSTQLTWGVYHNMGGGIKLYYEAISLDSGSNDGDRHLLGMRVDF